MIDEGSGPHPLVVVPTYQEATNAEELVARTLAALPSGHLLVVDDGSPDGTADLVEAAGEGSGRVTVLRRPAKSGLGSAYRDGFAWGLERGYDPLLEMDGDLSHDPAVLPVLVDAVAGAPGLAIGSRYVPGGSTPLWPRRRQLLSRAGNRYAAAVLGLPVRDVTAGFRAYRAETLRAIDFGSTAADGYAFQVEMTYRVAQVGHRVVEIPITFTDRVRGTSKMSGAIVAEAMGLVTLWGVRDRLLRRRPAIRRGDAGPDARSDAS